MSETEAIMTKEWVDRFVTEEWSVKRSGDGMTVTAITTDGDEIRLTRVVEITSEDGRAFVSDKDGKRYRLDPLIPPL